ncbi:TonB-dependent receptor [Sphingosinicella sp. LHD-64]|uniref:TonB-dependent receptor domain-containing protein n=1 Tax=Sphingosinicella sp. LHD-64 TaxID=3072139 RepID=UPI00280E7A75|nr:TonB-dependent receptor [Sphingosinicella sp. LHD-64]MDQ8755182.1 TonB-dependent receptor [Sphingosinicella sp. LHD-64]
MSFSRLLVSAALAPALCAAPAAWAQRTDDNAATAAEDAFGRSIGDSTIGIYSDSDVRGFSPSTAGNLRIHGLYYDQQGILTGRLQQGSTIRVGISAQSYPFPAPTGIADYSLREPGGETRASIGLNYGPRGGRSAELDLQLPLYGDRLGVALGLGINRGRRLYGGTPNDHTFAGLLRYAPRDGIELRAFFSRFRVEDDESQPFIFTSGPFLPKRFPRNRFFGQTWNDYSYTTGTYGVIADVRIAGFDTRFGLFRSVFDNDVSTADLLFGTGPDGAVASRLILRERGNRSASTSGELRVSRSFDDGPRRHGLIASLRARQLARRYGGGALIDLGPSRSDGPDPRPEPGSTDGPKTRDLVEQATLGIAYQLRWLGVGELTAGVQRTDYLKRITSPDPGVLFPDTRDSPWLPSATAAFHLTPQLALYAGYVRGLEESPVGPPEAVNRNEAPPAIRTRQIDGGLRWSIAPGLTAVLGLFDISKPYFNVDEAGRFRQRGAVTNRGVELSVAGQIAPGLNVVAGNVLLDARISGEEVAAGTIGRRPIGAFVRRTLVSIDYRFPAFERLSIDALVDSSSARTANAANSLSIPARTIVNLGARYRFSVGNAPVLLRAQVTNLFNRFGWNVSSSGYFTPVAARTFLLTLAADLQA